MERKDKTANSKCWGGLEQRDSHVWRAGRQNGTTSLEKPFGHFLQGSTYSQHNDPAIPRLDVYPREIKACVHIKTCIGPSIASFCINHPKMETTWLSISGKGLPTGEHTCHGILLSDEKERITVPRDDSAESQVHPAGCRKTATCKRLSTAGCTEKKQTPGCQG